MVKIKKSFIYIVIVLLVILCLIYLINIFFDESLKEEENRCKSLRNFDAICLVKNNKVFNYKKEKFESINQIEMQILESKAK